MSDIHQKAWNDFLELCLEAKDKKTIAMLFDLFLTPEEKVDLASRYQIVKALLQKEKTQREIAEEYHVSIAKITRGSNELKRVNKVVLEYLKDKIIDF
jgi:TrpR family trp operon transcriptional repressor